MDEPRHGNPAPWQQPEQPSAPGYGTQPPQGYGQQYPQPYTRVAPPKRPNHVLHLILTVLTCGIWSSVWIVLTARYWNVVDYRDPREQPGMNKRALIAVGVLVVLGILGGLTAPAAFTTAPRGTSIADAPTKAAADDDTGTPAAEEKPDGVYAFGETVTFEDGSTLTAGKPVPFTPDEYAITEKKFKHHVKFKVTFVNNSKKVFNPALTSGSVSSGDTEGSSVYMDGLDAPDNKLLPGHKVTWWMGYGVSKPKKATLTVSVGFLDYDDAIFTNE